MENSFQAFWCPIYEQKTEAAVAPPPGHRMCRSHHARVDLTENVGEADLVCFEIVPALILIRDFETLHWLYDLYYEDLYDKNDWPSSQITNIFLIGEAFLYLSEGNRKRAQVVHDLIQLNRTSLAYVNYVRLFHGLLSLELFAAGGAPRELRDAAIEQIAVGVEATGFTRFLDLARRGRAINGA